MLILNNFVVVQRNTNYECTQKGSFISISFFQQTGNATGELTIRYDGVNPGHPST
jgi:hypothetical protein